MAKGNDGNYLQHCMEVEAAARLAKLATQGHIHIALAHGMAPCESFDPKKRGQSRHLIRKALEAARGTQQMDERRIVAAYRETKASCKNYPNTARLFGTVIGVAKLSGGIAEIDTEKHFQLARVWRGTAVKTACSSWRRQMEAGGVLRCPADLRAPWLLTMDPMTYSEKPCRGDSDKLHKCDIDLLSDALTRYIASGQPGMAVFFVYGVQPWTQPNFWEFLDELAERVGAARRSYWLTHQGGNKNLAGLISSDAEVLDGFKPPRLNVGRGCKKST